MRVSLFLLLLIAGLSGCDAAQFINRPKPKPVILPECEPENTVCLGVRSPDENTIRPRYRKGGQGDSQGFVEGVKPESLDETTLAEKKEALESDTSAGEKNLGYSIASLGDVAQQGFWLKTPLVVVETPGRIVWVDSGKSVNVTLLPKQDSSGGGSQISLAAMRALEIPLTDLPELVVYSQ